MARCCRHREQAAKAGQYASRAGYGVNAVNDAMRWVIPLHEAADPKIAGVKASRTAQPLAYEGKRRMTLRINFKSGKPIHLQVVDLIKTAAASGALRHGEALPSIGPLAEELRLNRNSVAKAYSKLESLRVIETLPGKRYFLKENHSPLRTEVRRKPLLADIDHAVIQTP